jgi:hypothetical protein
LNPQVAVVESGSFDIYQRFTVAGDRLINVGPNQRPVFIV